MNEIHIIGQIGNTYDEHGNIEIRGVELIDVLTQLSSIPNPEYPIFKIDSPGGYVSVGNDIGDLIASIPSAKTIAYNQCASIATKIFLSAKPENRSIIQGTEFTIHNPFIPQTGGDAAQLREQADDLQRTQDDLISFYNRATGTNKEALKSLMAIETTLTAEQCIKFGFASNIIPKETHRAVALFYNKNKMNKSLKERVKLAMAALKGEETPEVQALMTDTDKGTLETPSDIITIGDSAMLDGVVAPDGDYLTENGDVITVLGGVVTAYIPFVEMDSIEDLKAEIATLKDQLNSKTQEVASLESSVEGLVTELEAVAQLRTKTGSFTPPAQQAQFKKKVEEKQEVSMRDRKAGYKQNQK